MKKRCGVGSQPDLSSSGGQSTEKEGEERHLMRKRQSEANEKNDMWGRIEEQN